ncbi:MAG: hypothetical protein IJN54_06535 [Lachnospiraceae bacterium]|nr:hypothetical protein [Lachnospiraceae bacterium]
MKRKIALALIVALMCSVTACSGKGVNSVTENTVASEQTAGTVTEEQTGETTTETDSVSGEETEEMEAEDSEVRFQAEWTKDAVIYEVNVRQYTEEGTFNAFSEHLQTLKDMGITTLWFMPIHPISETKRSGTLGSYYSITDYRAVNPEFGTAEDFKALVDKAHGMGFKVMMDWVANHTGWDCAWIDEHPEWYTQDSSGNIISPEGMGWPDVADLNYDNMEMQAEMIECMKYWVQEYDIDGFRCDYATGVPQEFWEDARAALEEIKPVYMLAEDHLVESLLEEAFDFNYNWNLYDAMRAVARDSKKANTLKIYIPTDFPDGTYTLNFMDNHDKNSYEHTIMGAYGAEPMVAMFSFMYMIPGAPLIYSGDEIGLDHAIAFMEKDAIDWESSEYDYRPLLAELSNIKSTNPALHNGNYGGQINYYDLDNKNILSFYREKDGIIVKCIFNLSKREQTIDVSSVVDGTETVLLHSAGATEINVEDHPVSEENLSGEITVQPWEFWILAGEH